MFVYNLVTALCLIAMVVTVFTVVVSLCLKKGSERIEYIRSFKKGKAFIIYFIAIPLYWIGHCYAVYLIEHSYTGKGILISFFNAVNKIVNLVVLKYDASSISGLMDANGFYNFTVFVCFFFIGLNALMFTLSVFGQHIWELIQAIKIKHCEKERVIIFGHNEKNIAIYKSDDKRVKVLCDKLTPDECLKLYTNRIYHKSVRSVGNAVNEFLKRFLKEEHDYILIINTLNDQKNIEYCRAIAEFIEDNKENLEKFFDKLKVFVFGDPLYESIYENLVKDSFGCLTYLNKYQAIAMDFIDKYPLTKFMTSEHIDYESGLIKDGVDINVIMVGFGKTNQQIFKTSVANNQFLQKGDGDPVLKKVHYHLFDRVNSEDDKNLNHCYFRYRNEFLPQMEGEYLPLPEEPAMETFYTMDVNDCDFYRTIKGVVNSNKKGINYLIIAFGTDLENIDLTHKLTTKRQEWGIENLYIFTKVRKGYKDDSVFEKKNCFMIANEAETVYDIEKIVGDKIYNMAKLRNEIYDLEYLVTNVDGFVLSKESIEQNSEDANKNWYIKKSQQQRESSIYACLSIRLKLNLMGYDYCELSDEREAVSNEEYLSCYAKNDPLNIEHYNQKIKGKDVVYYSLDYKNSLRKNFAIHEHFRWNSFMLSEGTVPASIDQILNEIIDGKYSNGRNYEVRRHGNLTTFDGLVDFRQMIAKRDGKSEEEKDVIKYDYQLMDDVHWLLNSVGYKIVKR